MCLLFLHWGQALRVCLSVLTVLVGRQRRHPARNLQTAPPMSKEERKPKGNWLTQLGLLGNRPVKAQEEKYWRSYYRDWVGDCGTDVRRHDVLSHTTVTSHVELQHGYVDHRVRVDQDVVQNQIQRSEQQNAFRIVRCVVQVPAYLNSCCRDDTWMYTTASQNTFLHESVISDINTGNFRYGLPDFS